MSPPDPGSSEGGDHPRRIPFAPHDAAGWSKFFLTQLSLLLPGYSFILIRLRFHIHDFDITGFVVLLLLFHIAFMTAFVHTWRLTKCVPVWGAISFGISLILLPAVINFIVTTP